MASNSPKRLQRVKPKTYSTCLLYNTTEARTKLDGLVLAGCNPGVISQQKIQAEPLPDAGTVVVPDVSQLTVSDAMSCNYCDATFNHRVEQKRHYRSDWHRYNLKQRLKGRDRVTEEMFDDISGNISSLSGSDSDSDVESDTGNQSSMTTSGQRLTLPQRVNINPTPSSTDSESETGNQTEDIAQRLPKVYFKNGDGEMLSIYRCVLCHKKSQPGSGEELVSMATALPEQMTWAVFMAGGGHFAGAVFHKNEMVAHKTFHRYVVRAKRGTAQGSRDSQGNAPKSAGASLRRYNEAMLTQEIQDLLTSWSDHLQKCDRIFLRAPSFNRKIFFGGKTPPFSKDDLRIRLVPFQTRRPTHNEVRRVYEMLASIECYGDESHIQDNLPVSPPQVFNPDTGQLSPRDENLLSPRKRKLLSKKLAKSPLVTQTDQAAGDTDDGKTTTVTETVQASGDSEDGNQTVDRNVKLENALKKSALPDHVQEEGHMSSGTSTGSDTELVETMATINFGDLKEFAFTKKPKRKKKSGRKRRLSIKGQPDPDSNIMEEEKYHLKNSLYTACKTGNKNDLTNLLAVFCTGQQETTVTKQDVTMATTDTTSEAGVSIATSDVSIATTDVSIATTDVSIATTNEVLATNENGLIVTTKERIATTDNLKQFTDVPVATTKVSIATAEKADNTIITNHSKSVSLETKLNLPIGKTSQSKCLDATSSYETRNTSYPSYNRNSDNNSDKTLENIKSEGTNNNSSNNDEIGNNLKDGSSSDYGNEIIKEDSRSKDTANISSDLDGKSDTTTSMTNAGPPVNVVDLSPVVTLEMLSEQFGDHNTTLLHVASREGHGKIVTMLLEAGANPAIRDKNGHTPFMVAKDKGTRNDFRRFMGRWPDKYDYTAAQIPAPLTEEMETERKKRDAERKRAQKKARQEVQRVQRAAEQVAKAEQREKERFLNLSDREKRALAAEKRLVTQATSQGAPTPVLSRCFQCGSDMTGKVPFEYNNNKFCNPKCLQAHRKTTAKS